MSVIRRSVALGFTFIRKLRWMSVGMSGASAESAIATESGRAATASRACQLMKSSVDVEEVLVMS